MGNELLLVLSEKRAHVLVLVVATILLLAIIKNTDNHTINRHRLPNELFFINFACICILKYLLQINSWENVSKSYFPNPVFVVGPLWENSVMAVGGGIDKLPQQPETSSVRDTLWSCNAISNCWTAHYIYDFNWFAPFPIWILITNPVFYLLASPKAC